MDNKLKKFKLEDGSVVDGGRIIVATSTNFCAVISLEGDTRLAPNSVQLGRDFIGRTQADVGDLLYLDSDMNWAVSKDGWEEVEAQADLVPALSGQDDSALAAREVSLTEAEERLALRESALVEGETALQAKLKELSEREGAVAAREAAVVGAEAELTKAKAALAESGKTPAANTKGIKVTGG